MKLFALLFLSLAATACSSGTATSLPTALNLANTFSQLTSELDQIALGSCSIANAILPVNSTGVQLPVPAAGLGLKYIALGRGTQNYSCSSSNSSTIPVATGAAATLFDASCFASQSMTLLHELPAVIEQVPLGSLAFMATILGQVTNTTDLIIGEHYFNAAGNPFFDLKLTGNDIWMNASKNASVTAPIRVATPADANGSDDVAWLRLVSTAGNIIKEVYRVQTFNGNPPATCAGQQGTVLVDYAAEYWFYG
ncbi:malate dehydrogenase [Penicillium lagena]|uniref:malate dehydrogenase n=1 Tax=Penicillium lagena TaxID=94218 RepID=UPI0025423E50|nr:malate dehydrogenase [Penicillium lagena]KAJ5613266.1 malate dehydrogenase [Penicillium lagena]